MLWLANGCGDGAICVGIEAAVLMSAEFAYKYSVF